MAPTPGSKLGDLKPSRLHDAVGIAPPAADAITANECSQTKVNGADVGWRQITLALEQKVLRLQICTTEWRLTTNRASCRRCELRKHMPCWLASMYDAPGMAVLHHAENRCGHGCRVGLCEVLVFNDLIKQLPSKACLLQRGVQPAGKHQKHVLLTVAKHVLSEQG